jgi:hypothetical protein
MNASHLSALITSVKVKLLVTPVQSIIIATLGWLVFQKQVGHILQLVNLIDRWEHLVKLILIANRLQYAGTIPEKIFILILKNACINGAMQLIKLLDGLPNIMIL